MKTKKRDAIEKVSTWLPVFSGFYGTVWETDGNESEFEYINEQRVKNGLDELSDDSTIEWDYEAYHQKVAQDVTKYIGAELMRLGMIDGFLFEKLNSPREYNFANDSIDATFELSKKNKDKIYAYLSNNKSAFEEYLKRYESCSGFVSSYSANVHLWFVEFDEAVLHQHKLGAILDFIILNEDKDAEMMAYEHVQGNVSLGAKNYNEITGEK